MDYEQRVVDAAQKQLVGRTIARVAYMNNNSAENLGWERHAVVITLDDGTMLLPSRDDEGNDAGALFTNLEGELSTIAVVGLATDE
jgi:hypothetical protein